MLFCKQGCMGHIANNNAIESFFAVTAEVAYRGIIFYNPANNASLFLPSASHRTSNPNTGTLTQLAEFSL